MCGNKAKQDGPKVQKTNDPSRRIVCCRGRRLNGKEHGPNHVMQLCAHKNRMRRTRNDNEVPTEKFNPSGRPERPWHVTHVNGGRGCSLNANNRKQRSVGHGRRDIQGKVPVIKTPEVKIDQRLCHRPGRKGKKSAISSVWLRVYRKKMRETHDGISGPSCTGYSERRRDRIARL